MSFSERINFSLNEYDARCLDLRSCCDHVSQLAEASHWEELALALLLLAQDLEEHFGGVLSGLESPQAAGDCAEFACNPVGSLPESLRLGLRDVAASAEELRGGIAARPGALPLDPCRLRAQARRCTELFREGHALVLSRLPEAERKKLASQVRRFHRALWAVLAAFVFTAAAILAAPSLQRAWKDFRQENFIHDFVALTSEPSNLRVSGALGPEKEAERRWRWGVGPRTVITLELKKPSPVRLDYAVSNPLEGQELTLVVNGEVLARHTGLPAVTGMAQSLRESVRFQGRAGVNSIVFEHPQVNRFNFVQDDTPYAVAFLELTLATGLKVLP
jgi:hypothetical protein